MSKPKLQNQIYNIQGMHCASCELLMKEELCKLPGVEKVTADATKQQVDLKFIGTPPSLSEINNLISPFGYKAISNDSTATTANHQNFLPAVAIALVVAAAFLIIERLASGLPSTSNLSGILPYLMLGVAASLSSCAALIGGLILSLSKSWNAMEQPKPYPQLQFNIGRLSAFIILGGLLGLVGGVLKVSIEVTVALVIITSLIMIILGLQMLGLFPTLNKIQLKLPGSFGEKALRTQNSSAKYSPLFVGVATFLLPCGFTLSAQSQALVSGSFASGAMIMGAFALGTLPVLSIIGLSARHFTLSAKYNDLFLKTAGIIVILFALYTINNQFNVLGLGSFTDLLTNFS